MLEAGNNKLPDDHICKAFLLHKSPRSRPIYIYNFIILYIQVYIGFSGAMSVLGVYTKQLSP